MDHVSLFGLALAKPPPLTLLRLVCHEREQEPLISSRHLVSLHDGLLFEYQLPCGSIHLYI